MVEIETVLYLDIMNFYSVLIMNCDIMHYSNFIQFYKICDL